MNEKNFFQALKELAASFKIKKNKNKTDLNQENPGWAETEDEYQQAQKEWLNKVKKRKNRDG
ncbi:MAG: hypothetical protein ACQEQS_04770 [Thermodesulfobacteriota bacterium]